MSIGSYRTADNGKTSLWLWVATALILAQMAVGAITRLTDSGLSMVEWRPLLVWFPPFSEEEWARVYELYRQTSEFQLQNLGMSVEDFKTIFMWEYGHRLLGRLVGLFYGIGLVFFLLRGRLTANVRVQLVMLFLLGVSQAIVGWWMVQSGFVDRVDVAPLRLAIHLSLAMVLFAWTGTLAWTLTGRERNVHGVHLGLALLTRLLWLVVLAQVFLGGMVAGSDAALVENTWPLMSGGLMPAGVSFSDLLELGIWDYPNVLQFGHRSVAYVLTLLFAVTFAWAFFSDEVRPGQRLGLGFTGLLLFAQLILGISTLLTQAAMTVAVFHQVFAALLFLVVTVTTLGMPTTGRRSGLNR